MKKIVRRERSHGHDIAVRVGTVNTVIGRFNPSKHIDICEHNDNRARMILKRR